jgi:hypothetical protein
MSAVLEVIRRFGLANILNPLDIGLPGAAGTAGEGEDEEGGTGGRGVPVSISMDSIPERKLAASLLSYAAAEGIEVTQPLEDKHGHGHGHGHGGGLMSSDIDLEEANADLEGLANGDVSEEDQGKRFSFVIGFYSDVGKGAERERERRERMRMGGGSDAGAGETREGGEKGLSKAQRDLLKHFLVASKPRHRSVAL